MTVLLCYDGSEASRAAIDRAAPLLADRDAIVAHAWIPLSRMLWDPFLGSPGPLVEQADALDEGVHEKARRIVAHGAEHARAAGFAVQPVLARQDHAAWRALLEVAEHHDAATIVAGTHGHSRLGDAVLGSTASGLLHHAHRPVLVVPAPGRPAPAS